MKKKSRYLSLTMLVLVLALLVSVCCGVYAKKSSDLNYSKVKNNQKMPFNFSSTVDKNGLVSTSFQWLKGFAANQQIQLIINEIGTKKTYYYAVDNKKLDLNAIRPDKVYAFDIKVSYKNDTIITSEVYTGELHVKIKEDSGHVIEVEDSISKVYLSTLEEDVNEPEMIIMVATRYEVESNDSFSLADRFYDDDDVYGRIYSSSDIDYYKISFPYDGVVNFWLGEIPSGKDYDLYVYDQNQVLIASSLKSSNYDELISEKPVVANQDYYVKVKGYNGCYDTSNYYHLRAKVYTSVSADIYESNDTSTSATSRNSSDTLYANLHSESDIDYYKFSISTQSDFSLSLTNIPAERDYDLRLYNSSLSSIASSLHSDNSDESITIILDPGTYYIKVYSYRGFSSSNYTLSYTSTSLAPAESQWYSQIEPNQTGADNSWNDDYLDKLFFPNMADSQGKVTPFEWNKWNQGLYTDINPSAYDAGHVNKWGCYASAYAMILKNLGAKTITQETDFRTGYTGYLDADPFTIMLANTQFPAVNYNSSNQHYEITSYTLSNTPVYMYYVRVANAFGYDVVNVDLSGKTAEEKSSTITQHLNSHPEGVHLRISYSVDGSAAHSLVFTKSTYSVSSISLNSIEKGTLMTDVNAVAEMAELNNNSYQTNNFSIMTTSSFDSYFTVCDPGTQWLDKGDNVNFTNSYSYSNFGGIPHLVLLQYFVKR